MKIALKTVSDGADMLPPLKAALIGVLSIMETVDVRSAFPAPLFSRLNRTFVLAESQNIQHNQEGFTEIARKISKFERILARYTSKSDLPPDMSQRLVGLSS